MLAAVALAVFCGRSALASFERLNRPPFPSSLDQTGLVALGPGSPSDPSPFPLFTGDELQVMTRDTTGVTDFGVPGPEGRVSSRNGASYSYDLEGRRLSDDRFDYVWNWRGELVSGTVKACWPVEPLVLPSAACGGTGYQSPYAGQKILFEG